MSTNNYYAIDGDDAIAEMVRLCHGSAPMGIMLAPHAALALHGAAVLALNHTEIKRLPQARRVLTNIRDAIETHFKDEMPQQKLFQ